MRIEYIKDTYTRNQFNEDNKVIVAYLSCMEHESGDVSSVAGESHVELVKKNKLIYY